MSNDNQRSQQRPPSSRGSGEEAADFLEGARFALKEFVGKLFPRRFVAKKVDIHSMRVVSTFRNRGRAAPPKKTAKPPRRQEADEPAPPHDAGSPRGHPDGQGY
jgi:hypothetical protein